MVLDGLSGSLLSVLMLLCGLEQPDELIWLLLRIEPLVDAVSVICVPFLPKEDTRRLSLRSGVLGALWHAWVELRLPLEADISALVGFPPILWSSVSS